MHDVKRSLILLFVAVAAIVATAANKSVEFARRELATHLKTVLGTEKPAGWTFRFERPADAAEPAEFESVYKIDGQTVWFWGDDRGAGRYQRWGTLFAVELFAESELGLRWLWPGDDGTLFTPRERLELPAAKTGRFVQPLEKSDFRNYTKAKTYRQWESFAPKELRVVTEESCVKDHEDRALFLRRHRLQDRLRAGYGHAFTKWKDRFEKSHPEYLNWNEKRQIRGFTGSQGRDRTKLCVSNEAVVDQIIADWCAAGTNRYLNVCENDSAFWCECAGCRKLDCPRPGEKDLAHVTDRYVNLWNRIARKAIALRPDVVLIAYAYSDYRLAPRRERIAYPDHMLFGFVPSIMDDAESEFVRWRERGMAHFFLRPNYHCFWGTIPRGLERFLYDNFHNCLKLGMIGVDYDSNLGRYPMRLESYVTARMISDPTAPFETICSEFYAGYGAAAPEVRRYFEMVRENGERARCEFMAARAMPDGIIDDSQLSHLQTFGRSEKELEDELAILKEAYRVRKTVLSPAETRRLRELLAAAAHAVVTFRFHTAEKLGKQVFETRGRELIAFRKKYHPLLPEDYGAIFGRWEGEIRTWNKTDFWRAEMDGGSIDPRGVEYGWTCNFDRPGWPLGWRGRDSFLAITNDCASTGEWSVKLSAAPGRPSHLATWYASCRVIPGRAYTLTADWKVDPGVGQVSMRVVARENPKTGEKSKDLVNRSFYKLTTDRFTSCTVEFEVPADRPDTVTLYTSVGNGPEGACAWFDQATLRIRE